MGIGIEKGLYLLFDRLGESLVTPKGSDATVFKLNKDYLVDEFKSYGIEVNRRYCDKSENVISLEPLKKMPDLSFARDFTRDQEFSIFIPAHRKMADELINVFLDVPENDLQDFLSICAYAREMLNCQLFFYCYSVALMHRQDTKNIIIPNLAEVFPAKLMDYVIFAQAREAAAVCAKGGACIPIVIPRNLTATDKDIEHRVAYFREDLGVNLHHRYWHVVYPYSGRLDIVNKDRRGELFFYMHSQMLARYNAERLSNQLSRVKRFNNWDEPIPEAYFPKLDSLTASRGYAPRQADMYWQDVDRSNAKVSIAEMKRWRRNIEDAIAMGMVRNKDGSTSRLTIDILGNMIEASILSPNPDFYGSLHNNGHLLTGYIHDPADRYLENFAVMADEATTMRDPFFYRWHMFIDDIFQSFKESPHVPQYTEYDLSNPGVQIRGVRVENDYGDINILKTFWMQSDVDIAGGLDFSERASVYTRFTHLNYRPFKYIIDVNNKGEKKRATARIFMAPKHGEGNVPWIQYADQRKMFIEMDRFVVKLKPGDNHIVRLSTKSSVTIPFEKTFRNLTSPPDLSAAATNYCGCGWPQHMLVPRGTETGTKYDLFVMLSNYDMDSVDNPDGSTMTCEEASSFCGIKNKKYPDRRDMGFPFDRPTVGVSNVKDLNLPNMSLIDITIRLEDVVEINPLNPHF